MALSKREISGGLSLGSIGVLPRPGSGPKGCKSTRLDTRDFLIPQIIQNTLYPLQPRLQSVHVRFGRFICYFLAGDVACCAVGTSIGLIVVKSQRIFRRRHSRQLCTARRSFFRGCMSRLPRCEDSQGRCDNMSMPLLTYSKVPGMIRCETMHSLPQ